jgi:hypothetical protein
MLEVNRHAAHLDVQSGDEFAFDVIGDAAETFVADRGGEKDGDRHGRPPKGRGSLARVEGRKGGRVYVCGFLASR